MTAGYRGYRADYTLPDGSAHTLDLPRRCAARTSQPYRWAVVVLEPSGPRRHSVHAAREAAEVSLALRSREGYLGRPRYEALVVELSNVRPGRRGVHAA